MGFCGSRDRYPYTLTFLTVRELLWLQEVQLSRRAVPAARAGKVTHREEVISAKRERKPFFPTNR